MRIGGEPAAGLKKLSSQRYADKRSNAENGKAEMSRTLARNSPFPLSAFCFSLLHLPGQG
jgi:hypothetical protein